jgi:hypothetical protein
MSLKNPYCGIQGKNKDINKFSGLPLDVNNLNLLKINSCRKGEPNWAEAVRLLVRFLSLGILMVFLAYNVNDVLTSTISTSTSRNNTEFIEIPGKSYPIFF